MNKFAWYNDSNKSYLKKPESKLANFKAFLIIGAVLTLPILGAVIQQHFA